MARTIARFRCSLWRDEDWRALSKDAQRAYHLILEQPQLSLAGRLDLVPHRWANLARDDTVEALTAALEDLAAHRFIVLDWDTSELVVRTFARHDVTAGRLNRKLAAGFWSAWQAIESPLLRHVVVIEAPDELWESLPEKVPSEAHALRAQPLPKPQVEPDVHCPIEPEDRAPTERGGTPPDAADRTPGWPLPADRVPLTADPLRPGAAFDDEPDPDAPPLVQPGPKDRLSQPSSLVELMDPGGPVAVRREATAVLDAAAERASADRPVTPDHRTALRKFLERSLAAGYDSERLATATAVATVRTPNGVDFAYGQLTNPKPQPQSVGDRGIPGALAWINQET